VLKHRTAYFNKCFARLFLSSCAEWGFGRQVACFGTVPVGIPGGLFLMIGSLARYQAVFLNMSFSEIGFPDFSIFPDGILDISPKLWVGNDETNPEKSRSMSRNSQKLTRN